MIEEKVKCPDCEKEFDNEQSMIQHKKAAHREEETKTKKPINFRKILRYSMVAMIIIGLIGSAYWILSNSSQTIGTGKSFDFSFVPYEGNESAKINFIEFGDYQCPLCSQFFTQSQSKLASDYVSTGKVKFYFMDFAFIGPDSFTLSNGAWCANDQGYYYAYHDYIYANQGQENSGWATPNKLKTLAANINGLNTQQFNSCLDTQKYQSRTKLLTSVGSNSGLTGTPTFFIGNNKIGYVNIVGDQPYTTFTQTIDSQLSKV